MNLLSKLCGTVAPNIQASEMNEIMSILVFSEMNLPNKANMEILLQYLLFTQNTSNLVQNVLRIDLRHSRMKCI